MWRAGTGGGPPIAAAGLIWTIGQNGTLYGLSPATGRVQQQAPIGSVANHFPTPAVAGGLLLAPTATDVVAFSASGSRAVTPDRGPHCPDHRPDGPAGRSAPTAEQRRAAGRGHRGHRGRRPGADRRGRLAAVAAADSGHN